MIIKCSRYDLFAPCGCMYMQVWNFTDFIVLIAVSRFYPLAIVYMNFSRLQCNVFSASTCDVLVFL